MHLHAVYAAEVAIGAGSATFEGHVHQLEIRDAGYFFRHLHSTRLLHPLLRPLLSPPSLVWLHRVGRLE
jgi:hypothetical protein